MQKHGNKYGTHRVIEPVGVLPQPANKLNNNMDEISTPLRSPTSTTTPSNRLVLAQAKRRSWKR